MCIRHRVKIGRGIGGIFELFLSHDDVIKLKRFPRYWPFVRGIHRSPVNSPHKGQWHGDLMFSLICAWINDWVYNREAGDLRHQRAHYDVIVMHKVNSDHFVHFYISALQVYIALGINHHSVHRYPSIFRWYSSASPRFRWSDIIERKPREILWHLTNWYMNSLLPIHHHCFGRWQVNYNGSLNDTRRLCNCRLKFGGPPTGVIYFASLNKT